METRRGAFLPGSGLIAALLVLLASAISVFSAATTTRAVRILNTIVQPGANVTVVVEMDTVGDENAVGFSVNFDPSRLTFNTATVGAGAAGATLNVNDLAKSNGRVGILIGVAPGQSFAAGRRELVRLNFTAGTVRGETPLTFGDQPIVREVSDNKANAVPATFTGGNVRVNSPPTATPQSVTTNEDTPQTIVLGGQDPDGDALTFTVATGPTRGTLTGTAPNLTYTPSANLNGPDSFTFTVTDGFATSEPATINITVNPVNDAPSFIKGANQTVLEDAGPQTVTAWATSISAGPSDEASQALSFQVSNNNTTLFSAPPAIAANGTLTYTPAANANGIATVTVTLKDNGGTASGGVDTSAAQTFTITVTAVNDAPSFTKGADQTVLEDAGTQTVTAWATNISAGPSDEASQTLTFQVSNNNTTLFSAQPAIASNGTLTYTPAANANGNATVTVTLKDNGGTANGGIDTSAAQTLTITVTAVNDAPSFTKGADQTVLEDAGPQTVTAWAANISAGPSDEASQTLTFQVSNNNTTLFSSQPAISSNGTLTYTPAANANGNATVTVTLKDNGGNTNGGVDTSAAQTFTITVTAVNDAPILNPIVDQTINEGSTLNLAASASDVDTGDTLTFSLLPGAPAGASINPSTGVFTWTPTEAQGPGAPVITIRVTDSGGLTAQQSFTVFVNEVNAAPTLAPIGPQSVDEGTQLRVATVATDTDIPANILTFSLEAGAASGAAIDSAGVFTWTPTESQGPGTFNFTIRVTDNGTPALSATQTFSVAVREVNAAPTLATIPNQTVDEGSTVTFVASATDPDLPANSLTFSLGAGAPAAATINASTGAFAWTTTEADGPGSYSITVRVTDNGTPALSATQTFTVTVREVNVPPVIAPIPNQTIDEGTLLSLQITATDSDLPRQTLVFSLGSGAATGASIEAATGVFRWTPTEAQGPGTYTFTVQVSDGTATATQNFSVAVNEVNSAPTIAVIPDQTIAEGATLDVTPVAQDADIPANTLTFSLVPGAPAAAKIDANTGRVTWTTGELDGPSTNIFTIQVRDNGTPSLTATRSFTVIVTEVNTAPVLAPITDKTVRATETLTFQASATDADLPPNLLTFSLGPGAPAGATITAAGLFSWTPTIAQGGNTFTITVQVADNGIPSLTATQTLRVAVTPANTAPVVPPIPNQTIAEGSLLRFTVIATDNDIPKNTLAYAFAAGTTVPTGATIDSATGVFTWTPSEAQGPGTYLITIAVTDNGTPSLTTTQQFTADVTEVNSAPVFAPVPIQTVNEGQLLTLTLSATDSDLPANTVTFSLVPPVPAGLTLNPVTGVLTWTPTEAQGPSTNRVTVQATDNGTPPLSATQEITIVVNEVNTAPVLAPIPNQVVNEEELLTFTVTATDPDVPANHLTFSLAPDSPFGLRIDPASGVVTWTPSEGQGPSTNLVTIRVTDDGTPPLTASQTITIVVREVNKPPKLTPIPDQVMGIGGTLTLPNTFTDPDVPANRPTFFLDAGPTGATINPDTGVFIFTPTAAQAPSTNRVTIRINDNGSPPLSDTITFTIVVRAAANQPPTITLIPNQTTKENQATTSIPFTVNDADTPPANLKVTFSSSNPNLVPVANIVVSGQGNNRTVTILPAANQTGTATITLTAEDNTGGKASTTFDLNVTATPPVITRQPISLEVTDGGAANFEVGAVGTGPLGYQWRKNGINIPGATNPNLAFPSVTETNAAVYSVIVSNRLGQVTSTDATLSVNTPLRIVKQPVSQTVLEGGNATFVVAANGKGQLSHQWRRNGVNLPGATNPSLILQNVTTNNAGDYTVVVSNASGSVTSVVATLTVNVPVGITLQPQSQAVLPGANVIFRVQAAGTGPFRYQWQYNGSDLPGETNPELTLNNVTVAQAGRYTVVVSNPSGNVTSAPATLTVVRPPLITQGPQSQTVVAGGNAVFNAAVSGSEPLVYQWRVNGVAIQGANGPTYTINNAQSGQEGDYTVEASNIAGSVISAPATLTVNQPVSIRVQPIGVTVNAGETITLRVLATGTGNLLYQWRFNGVDILGETSQTLTLANIQTSAGGKYDVVVKNQFGAVVSNPAIVIVNQAITITEQPTSLAITNRGTALFRVSVVGTGPFTYRWRHNGTIVPGAAGSILILNNVSPADAGFYTAEIQNVVGSVTSAPASLTIFIPPSIQTQPVSQRVQPGSNVSLSVVASGDPPVTYQWSLNGVNLPGKTSATLTLNNVQAADAGNYRCTIDNAGGSISSDAASIQLILEQKPGGDSIEKANSLTGDSGTFDGGNNAGGAVGPQRKALPAQTSQARWFSWTASVDGIVTFSTVGSTFDTVMTVYRGTKDNLIQVAQDDDSAGFLNSSVTFNAVKATLYQIKVEGFGGAIGSIVVGFKLQATTLKLPELIVQPRSQTVLTGSDVTFTVEATGTSLSYQWFANGVALAGATSSTLPLRNVQDVDAQRYSVRVTSGSGANATFVESQVAILQLGVEDSSSQDKFRNASSLGGGGQQLLGLNEPKQIRLAGGSVARGFSGAQVFNTFGATKEQGEPNHAGVAGGASQWFTYSAPGDGTLRVSTEGSNFDTVLAVYTGPGTDFASLKLEGADNDSGADGKTSVLRIPVANKRAYYVAVDGVKGATGLVKLSYDFGQGHGIATQPQNQAVVLGTDATFSVAVTNALSSVTTNVPAVTYQWLRDGLLMRGENGSILRRSRVQLVDVGKYQVVVSSFAGSVTSTVAQLTVNVPVGITVPPQNQTVRAGDAVELKVVASGTDPISYQWRKDSANLVGATNAILRLQNVQPEAAGNYTVAVNNPAGSVSASATVSVTQAPVIVTQPANVSVAAGATARFVVQATGTAPLAYQWRFNGVNIVGAGATTATLDLTNVQVPAAGEYTVVVSNGAGSVTSAAANLTVRVPLRLAAGPQNQTVTIGSSAVFSLLASGTGPFNYQWKYATTALIGQTNANLVIANVQTNNVGEYSVIVSADGQSVESPPATLSVNEVPVITKQPVSQVGIVTGAITFSVTVSGSGLLKYQWLHDGTNIVSATNSAVTLQNLQLSDKGSYSVVVNNAAGTVASDLAVLTVQTLMSPPTVENGVFKFRLNIPEGKRATIQSSTDLTTWTDFTTTPIPSGPFDMEDKDALRFELRFYRVLIE